MKVDEDKARWFDLGAKAHERGVPREDARFMVEFSRDAWLAGYDASAFYGLQRTTFCAEVDD